MMTVQDRFVDRRRPKLRQWRIANGLTREALGALIGVSGEVQVGRYELPFDNLIRQIPGLSVLERIVAITGGEVTAADFYPPHLNGPPSEPGSQVMA